MRGAASGSGTRRKYVHVGSVAASMPPHGPAPGYGTTPPLFTAADGQAMISGRHNACGFHRRFLQSMWLASIHRFAIVRS
ncbi:hypothetical protein E1J23_01595 [Xanthomonas gardneri]|nr:hypothetical protein [Xanthomonas hortorum pv. vitians]NMI46246.1 hypothetical protein [Xanthomonas hortorum pv. gardneri]NMI50665.1 hypothetical protein [Xanthomonas hortorum pv. taraxaci]PPU48189.1 hypothetical protein XcyCFBP4188_06735 [Xanthomonas hortorum pv. cynarae]QEW14505.1 hypothetical protein DYQ48_05350 [Xanthomonas hortorum]